MQRKIMRSQGLMEMQTKVAMHSSTRTAPRFQKSVIHIQTALAEEEQEVHHAWVEIWAYQQQFVTASQWKEQFGGVQARVVLHPQNKLRLWRRQKMFVVAHLLL